MKNTHDLEDTLKHTHIFKCSYTLGFPYHTIPNSCAKNRRKENAELAALSHYEPQRRQVSGTWHYINPTSPAVEVLFLELIDGKLKVQSMSESVVTSGSVVVLYLAQFGKTWWHPLRL